MMLLTKHPLSHYEKITIVTACSLSINKDGHLNNTGNPLSFISNLFQKSWKVLMVVFLRKLKVAQTHLGDCLILRKPPTCLR